MSDIAVVIMHGSLGESRGERMVDGARRAATSDLVASLRRAGAERVLLSTDDPAFLSVLTDSVVPLPSPCATTFHFGATLAAAVASHRLRGVVYFGSGTGFLLPEERLRELLAFAERKEPGALLNNPFSVDFAAISGARLLPRVALPALDNPLGFALHEAGFRCRALPRTLETQFDIDTPTDALLLAAATHGGPSLRQALQEMSIDTQPISRLLDRLRDRSRSAYIMGRVHPEAWSWFQSQVACRTGGVIEGRGARSSPGARETLLGSDLTESTATRLIDRLARACDAAIIDTRPFLAPKGDLPRREDRFACDLLLPEEVSSKRWAAFAAAARDAPMPVLLGGHNLVSGGLFLLGAICWNTHDLPRRLTAEPYEWSTRPHDRPLR